MKTSQSLRKNSQQLKKEKTIRKNSDKVNSNEGNQVDRFQCDEKNILKLQPNYKKQNSFIKQIKSLFIIPTFFLLTYFTLQMIVVSTFYLAQDIYLAFNRFFSQIKHILQQNTLFLLFWSVIIIKTKLPQLQRLFYHTIVKTILIEQQDNQCSICLAQQCDYLMPKCQHSFHALCLQKWLKNNPYCPYCRMKVDNKLVRKVPWKKFLNTIYQNKLKWILVFGVFIFVQYRFYYYDLFPFTIKQKE